MNNELLKKVGEVVPEEILQALLSEWDPVIRVDRSVKSVYPDFVKEVKYPELELTGPAEFDVRNLNSWLHPKQKKGVVTGNDILRELIAGKLLEDCLGFTDLQAIQARGVGFFRKHFSGKAVFGWKSVVLVRDGHLRAPYLFGYGDVVELYWRWLGDAWYSFYPALRHAS